MKFTVANIVLLAGMAAAVPLTVDVTVHGPGQYSSIPDLDLAVAFEDIVAAQTKYSHH